MKRLADSFVWLLAAAILSIVAAWVLVSVIYEACKKGFNLTGRGSSLPLSGMAGAEPQAEPVPQQQASALWNDSNRLRVTSVAFSQPCKDGVTTGMQGSYSQRDVPTAGLQR